LRNEQVGDEAQPVIEKQHTDHDQEDAGDLRDQPQVPVHSPESRRHAAHGCAGDQEWNAQAQRIEEQQQCALTDRCRIRRDQVDGSQHRAHARNPARGEKDTHQRRRQVAPAPVDLLLHAALGVHHPGQCVDGVNVHPSHTRCVTASSTNAIRDPAKDTQHLEAKEDQDRAADLDEGRQKRVERIAEERHRSAQNHEDQAESDHEGQRVRKCLPAVS